VAAGRKWSFAWLGTWLVYYLVRCGAFGNLFSFNRPSLYFADGVCSLGANIFNMGIIGAIGGYNLYYIFSSFQKIFFVSALWLLGLA
jgi:ABC-type Co2+ transport system permease subunit